MHKVTGTILKIAGTLLISDGKRAIVELKTSSTERTYKYLVMLHGKKYTKQTRLKPHEIDYWFDTIKLYKKINEATKNGKKKNHKRLQG
ncbi:MAG: hypothetical protein K0A90_00020 [Methanosarcinaceae archaeon]|nr:hypothetical protein [Methanosarcinaceae archaeon]